MSSVSLEIWPGSIGGIGVAVCVTVLVVRCTGSVPEIAVIVYVVLVATRSCTVPVITPVSGLSVSPDGKAGDTVKNGDVNPVTAGAVVVTVSPITPVMVCVPGVMDDAAGAEHGDVVKNPVKNGYPPLYSGQILQMSFSVVSMSQPWFV